MYGNLKRLRVIFALVIFILITAAFLNFTAGNAISSFLLRLQFVPAMVSVFTGGFAAFALLLLLTLLFGRVYCSFLCPAGILQDIITRISDFIKKKANGGKLPKSGKGYKKPHNILRYAVLIITFGLFFAGIATPLAMTDPYSNYGTVSVQLFGTAELWINNILAEIFPATFYYQPYITLSLYAFIWGSFFLVIITIFSIFKGRLYCNTICPVGSLLGLVSGFSLFKPAIKKDMCVKCNACALNCKSNCIDLQTKEIDVTRCVACYNCMIACKRGGVKLVLSWGRKIKAGGTVGETSGRELESRERRNALIAMGALVSGIAAKKVLSAKEAVIPAGTGKSVRGAPVAPPGAGSIDRLKELCTACHACMAVCPNKIIKPAVTEYGIDGFMAPTITYGKKFCAFDCNECTKVCPHGALEHISLEEKQLTQIGKARYIARDCIVFADGTDCGACDEHCPTKAIIMTEVKNKPGLYFPKLNRSICIGCGACEYICPAKPKAIVIDGNAIQLKADPPKIEKQEEKKIDSFGF